MLKSLSLSQVLSICLLADNVKRIGLPVSTSPDYILPYLGDINGLDEWFCKKRSLAQVGLLHSLQALTRTELIELAALMWFGRGDAEFGVLLRHATANADAYLPYYLADKAFLAVHLRTGLDQLLVGESGVIKARRYR